MDNGIQEVPTIILYEIVTRLGYTEQVNVKVLAASMFGSKDAEEIKIHLIQ
jgi:hypothetical protein